MSRAWVIAPYGTKNTECHGTYTGEDKGFEDVWQYDLRNGVIAIGSSFVGDMRGKKLEEIEAIMLETKNPYFTSRTAKSRARESWIFFNEIHEGDIVIAKKGKQKILGIGKAVKRSGDVSFYSVEKGLERTGNEYNPHPNFLNVDWKEEIIDFGYNIFLMLRFQELDKMIPKKDFPEYGALIKNRVKELWDIDIDYDCGRMFSVKSPKKKVIVNKSEKEQNEVLKYKTKEMEDLINKIQILKRDSGHKERAHETLVEMFFELLDYEKFSDIKHRQGRIDISISIDDNVLIVVEVKKDWGLTSGNQDVVKQAYNYALETGTRFVIITNGDYYALYDRNKKGLSFDSHRFGSFTLTRLRKEDLELIEKLKKKNIIDI